MKEAGVVLVCFVILLAPALTVQVPSPFLGRAILQANRLAHCSYDLKSGLFPGELLWESANTIESLSSLMIAANSTKWFSLIQNTYTKTGPLIDKCYDDHQWWLLAWVRAYELTKDARYLERAAIIFDNTSSGAWTNQCGGGVLWCPEPVGTNGYKNAVTNELFLASAMSLHPYTSLLKRPANYYLNWAIKEWEWFVSSGVINSMGLINDGLSNQCTNNGGTTWTYNQGVLLNGLTNLYRATNDAQYLLVASRVAQAAFTHLTVGNSILAEPCGGNCDNDQLIFKGVFVRHLGYAANDLERFLPNLNDFLLNNMESVIANADCPDGSYGFLWQGPCRNQGTASESSVLDLFTSAGLHVKNQPMNWRPIGLGNCINGRGQSMPNCYRSGVTEAQCRAVAQNDAKAVAYDISKYCNGQTFCRIRTLGGPSSCLSGWAYGGGSATTVTTTNENDLTLCVLRN